MNNSEAITTHKEALTALVNEMEYVLSCINADKVPFDGDDFHEALRLGKEALMSFQDGAQPEQGCDYCNHSLYAGTICKNCGKVTSQPEHELTNLERHERNVQQLFGEPQPKEPEQRSVSEHLEPVAYQDTAKPTELVAAEDWDNIDPQWRWMYQPLYTTPPQPSAIARKPLTDEQINTIWHNSNPTNFEARSFARAIEAAHGIKEKNT